MSLLNPLFSINVNLIESKKFRIECRPCKEVFKTPYSILSHLSKIHNGEFTREEYLLVRRISNSLYHRINRINQGGKK